MNFHLFQNNDTNTDYGSFIPEDYMDCKPHGSKDIVHQTIKIPWPISPREILLEREFIFIPPTKDKMEQSTDGNMGGLEVDEEGRTKETSDRNIEKSSGEEDGVAIVRYHSVEDPR